MNEVYCRHCGTPIKVRLTGDGKNVIGLHKCPKAPDLYSRLLQKADERIAKLEDENKMLREKKLHRSRGDGANYKVGLNSEHYALMWYLVNHGAVSEESAIPMRELVRIMNQAGQRKRNGKRWEPNASTSGRLSEIMAQGYVRMKTKRVSFVRDTEDDFAWRFEYEPDQDPNVPRKWWSKPLWYATPEGCKEIHLKYDTGKEGREKKIAKATLPPDEKKDVA